MWRSVLVLMMTMFAGCSQNAETGDEETREKDGSLVLSKDVLKDKIKGAWAAQTIGVTFGAPIEFQYNSTMVQDNQQIVWSDTSLASEFKRKPGTYDDIYMDLTFMQVIQDNG